MQAFELANVAEQRQAAGRLYLEFLRVSATEDLTLLVFFAPAEHRQARL